MIIGITGGVGTGKSLVLDYLHTQYGAVIIQTDLVARELIEPGAPLYQAYIDLFGEETVLPDGTLDRRAIAARLYREPELIRRVNALVHPTVFETVKARIEENCHEELIVIETALPKEAKLDEICQYLWYIHTSVDVRIARIRTARGYSEEKCLDMIASQLSDEGFTALCDTTIENSGEWSKTAAQIDAMMHELTKKPAKEEDTWN